MILGLILTLCTFICTRPSLEDREKGAKDILFLSMAFKKTIFEGKGVMNELEALIKLAGDMPSM
ncbi:MAG: hypothetical protein MHPSP_003947, partial [Paramarteilia canceri]